MAEYCLKCYKEICKPEDVKTVAVQLSNNEDLCEGCGKNESWNLRDAEFLYPLTLETFKFYSR